LARWTPGVSLLVVLLALVGAGCGEGGAEEGAQLSVYVSGPLSGTEAEVGRQICDEARREARAAGEPGGFELRVVCLDAAGQEGRWTLAQIGANARQATEDSTAVAYLAEPEPAARRQSLPIVEAAGIAELGELSGKAAVAQVATAIEESDSDDPRQAVFDAVEG
jgi:ABC-type branched-subunit amino acid transport system substrate-binding protein